MFGLLGAILPPIDLSIHCSSTSTDWKSFSSSSSSFVPKYGDAISTTCTSIINRSLAALNDECKIPWMHPLHVLSSVITWL